MLKPCKSLAAAAAALGRRRPARQQCDLRQGVLNSSAGPREAIAAVHSSPRRAMPRPLLALWLCPARPMLRRMPWTQPPPLCAPLHPCRPAAAPRCSPGFRCAGLYSSNSHLQQPNICQHGSPSGSGGSGISTISSLAASSGLWGPPPHSFGAAAGSCRPAWLALRAAADKAGSYCGCRAPRCRRLRTTATTARPSRSRGAPSRRSGWMRS